MFSHEKDKQKAPSTLVRRSNHTRKTCSVFRETDAAPPSLPKGFLHHIPISIPTGSFLPLLHGNGCCCGFTPHFLIPEQQAAARQRDALYDMCYSFVHPYYRVQSRFCQYPFPALKFYKTHPLAIFNKMCYDKDTVKKARIYPNKSTKGEQETWQQKTKRAK